MKIKSGRMLIIVKVNKNGQYLESCKAIFLFMYIYTPTHTHNE
jgi:hypothetical protein